jgi:hypothetical protein
MLGLISVIRAQVAGAALSELIAGSMGFHSVTVTLPGGLSLLVSTDADLPAALFEVIRFVAAEDVQQYPFETRASLGSAFSDKLPTQGVVALLHRYMQPDVQPPAIGRASVDRS